MTYWFMKRSLKSSSLKRYLQLVCKILNKLQRSSILIFKPEDSNLAEALLFCRHFCYLINMCLSKVNVFNLLYSFSIAKEVVLDPLK